MPVRPPRALSTRSALEKDPLSASLEQEILVEKMATYARLVKRLEAALVALREYEEATAPQQSSPPGSSRGPDRDFAAHTAPLDARDKPGHDDDTYPSLLAAAGEALWHVVVQRDLCGLRRHDLFYKEYDVPAAVRLRMGLVKQRSS